MRSVHASILSIAISLLVPVGAQQAVGSARQAGPATGRVGQTRLVQSAGCQPSISSLKKLANDEWLASHDADRVLDAIDTAIGSVPGIGGAWEFIDSRDGLVFSLSVPPRLYRFLVSEALRKRDPIADVNVPSVVSIDVRTTQIDGPNIEKVLVERNGKPVPPLSNSLSPHVMVTRMGAKEMFNSGTLTFPCSVFFPGATVVVTGIPTSGDNLVREFRSEELEVLTGHPLPAPVKAGDLVGRSVVRAKASIGEPTTEFADRLEYDTRSGKGLRLSTSGREIVAASTPDALLSEIVPPGHLDKPKLLVLPPGTPNGAVGVCADGKFVFVSTGADTCGGYGGVADWFAPEARPQAVPAAQPAKVVPEVPEPVQIDTPKRPAGELMGKRQAEVRRLLGAPSFSQTGAWTYDTPKGSLSLPRR